MNPAKNISILIIDDLKLVVETTKKALEDLGFDLMGLTDPAEAIKLIKQQPFDIVITDLVMPDIDGMQVVDAVKESGFDTEIIVLTAYATLDTAIRSVQQRVYAYLQKPFNIRELQNLVKNIVEKLQLKRTNDALNNRIKKMLAEITLLYDLSNIVYQVQDYTMVQDMVLDSVTEGINLKRVGLLLPAEKGNKFQLSSSRNLDEIFGQNLQLGPSATVNGHAVPVEDDLVVDLKDGTLDISGTSYAMDYDSEKLILIPINFQQSVKGYIIVLVGGDYAAEVDYYVQLLKIIATQISPIFHNLQEKQKQRIHFGKRAYDKLILELMTERMQQADEVDGVVTFAFLRVVNLVPYEDSRILDHVISSYRQLISDELEENYDLVWQTLDTALVVLPNTDMFAAESICMDLRQRIETLVVDGTRFPLTLKYSSATYPQVGREVMDIISILWKQLFSELEKSTGKQA